MENEVKLHYPDDGCVYVEMDNDPVFKNVVRATTFDTSTIKNRVLDVQYGTLEAQKLDIFYPDSYSGPLPVIFYVHGGGWVMGSKLEGSLVSIIGAIKCGYAVITVDYRLATECAFPEFIFDVKTAVRWARAHAEEYSFDPDRFGMIGDSAGGHITLTMAFTADRPEYEGEKYGWPGYSSAIQAACDMYGPSDLAKDQSEFYRASQVKRIKWGNGNDYEVPFGTTKKELLELISPINMVHKNIPPLLIQHGYIDSVVAYQHSTTLKDKIDSVCGEGRADLRIYPDRNHADRGFTTPENTAEVIEFFDKHLK